MNKDIIMTGGEGNNIAIKLTTLKTNGIEYSGTPKYLTKLNEDTLRGNVLKYLFESIGSKGFDIHLEHSTPIDSDEKLAGVENYLHHELYGIAHTLKIKDGIAIVHVSELVD